LFVAVTMIHIGVTSPLVHGVVHSCSIDPDYAYCHKGTEQNEESLSNPSLVMASYSLQRNGSWLLWAARVCRHDDPM